MTNLDNKNTCDLIMTEAIEFKQEKRLTDKSLVYFRSLFESLRAKRFIDLEKWLMEDTSIKREAIAIINEVFPEWSTLNEAIKP